MTTRREILIGGLMAGTAGLLRGGALFAKGPQPATKVHFDVPRGACDCHVHVFGPRDRYPLFAGRTYSPDTATVQELKPHLAALHLDRVIVVQPSVYGTDNACTLDAIRELGDRARGVAVIDEKTPDAELDRMAKDGGIRGVRLNLSQVGINEPAAALKAFQAVASRAKPRGWHVQFNTSLQIIEAIAPQLLASPVPVVFDHFGGARGSAGVNQPGFAAMVNLVKVGKAYVKISGAADSVSTNPPDYPDALPLARALVAANPQRILWASNWPHPGSAPGRKISELSPNNDVDDGLVLNLLPVWVPDAATRRVILVDNPARLYGFGT
jgi:predicted TIM-barrel fold metal-dependent hydrolase